MNFLLEVTLVIDRRLRKKQMDDTLTGLPLKPQNKTIHF